MDEDSPLEKRSSQENISSHYRGEGRAVNEHRWSAECIKTWAEGPRYLAFKPQAKFPCASIYDLMYTLRHCNRSLSDTLPFQKCSCLPIWEAQPVRWAWQSNWLEIKSPFQAFQSIRSIKDPISSLLTYWFLSGEWIWSPPFVCLVVPPPSTWPPSAFPFSSLSISNLQTASHSLRAATTKEGKSYHRDLSQQINLTTTL